MNEDAMVAPAAKELEDLVTGGEIASRLGMSRARLHQLAARPDFPEPLGRVGQSKVWRWSDIRLWLPGVGRPPMVEIYSATDPINVRNRRVWYWVEVADRKYERTESYQEALGLAERLREQLNSAIIDRSDKGSGYLLSTLNRK